MRLDLYTDSLPFYDRKEFIHGSKPHAIADLLLIWIAGKFRVDYLDTHIARDLYHAFPVSHRKLPLLFRRTGPPIYDDKRRNLYSGFS